MSTQGYDLVYPAKRHQLARLMRHTKECLLAHPGHGISVELHWRLTENRRLLRGVDAAAPRQRVAIGRQTVPTFADAPLFAYLCVHGAVHGWSRLKWLADLSALLGGRSPAEIARLLRELEQRRGAKAIAAAGLRCMAHGGGYREFQTLSGPGWRRTRSQFQIMPGRRYAWSQLAALWTSGHERAQIELPESLDFLYHLLRLPLVVGRSGTSLFARLKA